MSTSCPLDARVYPTVHTESARHVLVSSTESPDAAQARSMVVVFLLAICQFFPLSSAYQVGIHIQEIAVGDLEPASMKLTAQADKLLTSLGKTQDLARPIRFRHDAKAPVSGPFLSSPRPCDFCPPIRPDLHSPRARRQRVRHRPARPQIPRQHTGRPSSRPVMASSTPRTSRHVRSGSRAPTAR